jgi:hypothetical protein
MGNGAYIPNGYGPGQNTTVYNTNGIKIAYTLENSDTAFLNYINGTTPTTWINANKLNTSPYMPEPYGSAPNFYQQT